MDKIKKLTGNNFFWVISIFIISLPVVWSLLRTGYFPMHDDLQAFRIHQLDKCLDDGQIPCRWVPDAGYRYGYPQFNYYPPLPYYVGAIMHRLGLQYIDSVKVLFVAGYLLSALTMYLLVTEILKNKWAGFVSAVLYTYIPYKAVEVYVRGALSEFWAQIFFPLVFWSVYKLIKTGKTKYIIFFALSIAGLATTHTLMTMIFAPIAILWAVYWLWREKWINIKKVFISGLLGFGLSAFFTLPVLFEKEFVHVDSMLTGYFDYRAHFVNLYKIFISNEWGYGSSGFPDEKFNLSVGIIQWIVGLGAIALAFFNRKKYKSESVLAFLIFIFALLTLFMMHMKSSFIWALLPPLWYMQFPWRFLAVSIFLLSLLSGYFVTFTGKYKYLLGGIIVIIAVILNINFFKPKDWYQITDQQKFSGQSWEKQMTISIFDYLPIYATLPPINEAPKEPEVMDGVAEIIEYSKGSNFQFGKVKVVEDSSLRLPLFDFPGMVVKVNGQKINHYNNDCRGTDFCYGLISVDLKQGEYDIEARLTDTPIRKAGNILTIISSLVIAWILLKKK